MDGSNLRRGRRLTVTFESVQPEPKTSPRPPTIFYIVGFLALALSIAGFVLSVQEQSAGIAAAATGIGAVGFLSCAWMLKRV
jgi:hypothetical protein